MKKRMISLALALCLALSLAVPVCAADVSDETTITPLSPIHPYSDLPSDTDDPNWSSFLPVPISSSLKTQLNLCVMLFHPIP